MGSSLVYKLIVIIRLGQVSALLLIVCLVLGRDPKLFSKASYRLDVFILRF